MDDSSACLSLTPHGRLVLEGRVDGRLLAAFERGSGHGLLLLGVDEAGSVLPPGLSYWREFGARYVAALCTQGNAPVAAPAAEELERIARSAPLMMGAEYLTADVLGGL